MGLGVYPSACSGGPTSKPDLGVMPFKICTVHASRAGIEQNQTNIGSKLSDSQMYSDMVCMYAFFFLPHILSYSSVVLPCNGARQTDGRTNKKLNSRIAIKVLLGMQL